ncbi:hypothetical protein F0562_006775 [Nyssa sinensis]|uniref:non-specific serine/threonine protein kinase n=1 Tax=Nyssa sinensis TaxID=561372 RepID=A0A5J5AM67_9ASTE|nr:hypothetical protein F0562_006775 [Nyssa sinensis]
MKHHVVRLLCILLIVVGLSGSTGEILNSEISKIPFTSLLGNGFNGVNPPARRTLLSLSDEHETALVAALDGTIYLMEPKSKEKLWSFTSGPSIYSSYQAPVNHDNDKENASGPDSSYFIDCGDDWELYMHTKLGKVKLRMNIEEFLRITPHITEDGGVVLGSKRTTVFLVDAKTGRLIYTYRLSDSSPTSQINEENNGSYTNVEERGESGSMNLKTGELPLYIMRTDYSLKSFDQKSGKVLWNMTVAEIGAASLCEDVENTFIGALSDSGDELPSESGAHFNMPLPCQSKALVYRFRSHNLLEPFHRPMLPEAHNEDMKLIVSTSNDLILLQPNVDKLLEFHHKNKIISEPAPNLSVDSYHDSDSALATSLRPLTETSGISGVQGVKVSNNDGLSMHSKGHSAFYFNPLAVILVGFVTYCCVLVARNQVQLTEQPINLNATTVSPKRRKTRKSGKSCGVIEKNDRNPSSGLEDEFAHIERDNKLQLNLNRLIESSTDGRTIGKLFFSNTEIAKGSNGTIVLEGIYEGRPVAVKRLVKAHHDVAFKEIQNLIASDRHPNIVRWYGVEYDQDFVYLALERCTCSLYDLIQMSSDFS